MSQPSQTDIDALHRDRHDPAAWDDHEVAATITPITDVLVGWIIDRSSSMMGEATAAVDGFNQFLTEQRALDGICRASALLFASPDQWTVLPAQGGPAPVTKHQDMTLATYNCGGNTALYDAMLIGIEALEQWVKVQAYTGQVKVVIFTDGQENASHYSSLTDVNNAVGRKQADGWEFVFLGSGGAAWLEGRSMSNMAASTYSVGVGEENVRDSFATVSSSVSGARRSGVSMAHGMSAAYGQPDAQQPDPAQALRDRVKPPVPGFPRTVPPTSAQSSRSSSRSRSDAVNSMAGSLTPPPAQSSREDAVRRMAGD